MHPKIEAKLQDSSCKYIVHYHAQQAVPIQNPQDFANALGYDLSRIAKTLFLKGDGPDRYGLAVCSINKKVDFALLASEMQCKRVQVAKREALQASLGYPPNGVSPLGVEEFPIFLDQAVMGLETVLVGAGEVGVEIEIAPADLVLLTRAVVLKFSNE